MANEKTTASAAPLGSRIVTAVRNWCVRNRWYFLAFFLPVVLMYISYAIFGLYPFGEKSVLALDLNAQYVYYFEALRDAFWGDGSFFYSWSRNLSGGYMGIIGYYLASPFTLIPMLLPEKWMLTSLLIMILCKIGSAGVTFSLYLQKSKGMQPLHATIFSLCYALMAYMVIQTIDPMWLDGLVMLPLVALGVEYLIDDGRKLNYIIPLAIMFVANFYIGYMIGIFTALYFIYYLFFGKEGKRGKAGSYVYTICNFGVSTLVAVMLSAFMILPVVNALQLGKFSFTDPDYSFQVQFEPVTVLAQMLTAQYDSVNVQGSPEIYCGVLTIVLLPIFFLNRKITLHRKLGYGFLLAAMFFSMYIKPVDMWWHGGQVPNWLPFRYSFIISFILLNMAAAAFEKLDGISPGHFGGIFFGILAVVLYIQGRGYEHLDIMGSIWLTIGLSAVYLIMLYPKKGKVSGWAVPVMLLCVISGELVFNTVSTLKDVDEEVTYSTKASYETYIQSGRAATKAMEAINDGLYRSEKTFSRAINDDLAFGLKGLTHSSSVMNAKTLTFIETLGYNTRSYYSRYDGTTELADSLMGIRYVLDRGDTPARPLLHKAYGKVGQYDYTDKSGKDADGKPTSVDKTISIYENPNALSIGYMVSEDLLRIDHLGNDNPFNSQNILLSTMLGQTNFDAEGQIAEHSEYYTPIDYGEPVLGAVTVGDYNGQATYTKMDSGDPTVDYRFTVESTEEIFCFLKTENEQKANLWLGVWNEEKGDYDFKGYGVYFDAQSNYCIFSMGEYAIGTKLSLRLTVDNDQNAIIVKKPFFYYFDRDTFQTDIDKLKAGQLQVTKYSDTYIKGTVEAQDGQMLFTSIPYEPGWTVKVDGKKVKTSECIKAMIYVPLEAGTHTVTFSYIPPGFVAGVILFVIGVGMLVLFYRYDRENNKVLRERRRKKKAAQAAA